jgi:hypothetical protein
LLFQKFYDANGKKTIRHPEFARKFLAGEERCYSCRKPHGGNWRCWLGDSQERGQGRCLTCQKRSVKCEWEKDDGGVRERKKRRAEGEEEEDEEREKPRKRQRTEERRKAQKSRSEVEDSEAVQTEVPSGRERGSSRASNDTIAAIDGIRDVLGSLVAEQRRTNRWLSRINQHLLSRNQMLSEQAVRDEE